MFLWVADNHVELEGIILDTEDIALTIQWYKQITGISGSDLVYKLYCGDPTQVQIHTQIVHGNILITKVYGTAASHPSARNKSTTPSE